MTRAVYQTDGSARFSRGSATCFETPWGEHVEGSGGCAAGGHEGGRARELIVAFDERQQSGRALLRRADAFSFHERGEGLVTLFDQSFVEGTDFGERGGFGAEGDPGRYRGVIGAGTEFEVRAHERVEVAAELLETCTQRLSQSLAEGEQDRQLVLEVVVHEAAREACFLRDRSDRRPLVAVFGNDGERGLDELGASFRAVGGSAHEIAIARGAGWGTRVLAPALSSREGLAVRRTPLIGFLFATSAVLGTACNSRPVPTEAWSASDHAHAATPSQDDTRARPQRQTRSPAEQRAAAAAALYRVSCAGCHGAAGRGDGAQAMGADLADFTSAEWQSSVSDEEIAEVITLGRPPMPAFGERLPADGIAALVAHVRSLAAR